MSVLVEGSPKIEGVGPWWLRRSGGGSAKNASEFKGGRELFAWTRVVPRSHSPKT